MNPSSIASRLGLLLLAVVTATASAALVRAVGIGALRRPQPEATKSFTPRPAATDRQARLRALGAVVFVTQCARCHGDKGRGDGPDAERLAAAPRDLTSASSRRAEPTVEAVRRITADGLAGTPMPPFGGILSRSELDAVSAFVADLAHPFDTTSATAHDVRTAVTAAGLDPLPRPRRLPDLEFAEAGGAPRRLSDYRGRVVLLTVWGTTCVSCLEELPDLDRLARLYAARGLSVISICGDESDPDIVRQVGGRRAPGLPLFVDRRGTALPRLDVTALPTTLLIDRDGRLVARIAGARSWVSDESRRALEALLGDGLSVASGR